MHPGLLLGDRYELRAVLGRGGQSTVYRAFDRVDGDEVAIKVVHGASRDPDATERVFREAQTLSQLQGTAAVRVLHQVYAPDGSIGLVMELLEGRDLDMHLGDLEARGEKPSFDWIVRSFEPIVETLMAAHDRGLVHRDLKAENLFLVDERRGGGIKLLDFGFVKLLRAPPITDLETVVGSPSYIAPETWLKGASAVDCRSDAYSLAVVLYRTLAGHLPFVGAPMEVMHAVTQGPRPALVAHRPELAADADRWVEQALSISPQERFHSVRATWVALKSCFPVQSN